MNALPIAVAFIGAMSAFGCWTFFLAQDSLRRPAVQSPPHAVVPPLRLNRDEPRSPARGPLTRLAVLAIAGLIIVSVLAGGPRPPTRVG
jgi:hypothetical protein